MLLIEESKRYLKLIDRFLHSNRKSFLIFMLLVFSTIYYVKVVRDHQPLDSVALGGDMWQYHSKAVNFANGHGLKMGGILPFEKYKFRKTYDDEKHQRYVDAFVERGERGGEYNTTRNWIYPFFAGVVYKIFGVSPKALKKVQSLMLYLSGVIIIYSCFYLYGNLGALVGFLGTYPLMVHNFGYVDRVLIETLIVFIGAIAFFLFIKWKNSNISWGPVTGFIFGLMALTKGTLLFIPCFAVIENFFETKSIKKQLPFLLSFILVIAAYSSFVSSKANRFIFITDKGQKTILGGHNENMFNQGIVPEGVLRDDRLFYHREDIKDKGKLEKIALFYSKYWFKIPQMIRLKIDETFNEYKVLHIIFGFGISIFILRLFYSSGMLVNHVDVRLLGVAFGVFEYLVASIVDFSIAWILLFAMVVFCTKNGIWLRSKYLPSYTFYSILNFAVISVLFWGAKRYMDPFAPYLYISAFLIVFSGLHLLINRESKA